MLTAKQIEDLESLAYMWDSNGGWVIDEWHEPMDFVMVQFSSSDGPRVTELARMRQLLPELGELSPAEAKVRIGKGSTYVLGDFPRQAGNSLRKRGRELGLSLLVRMYIEVSYHPMHIDGTPPPIMDDDEEAKYVVQKMRATGRPVRICGVDRYRFYRVASSAQKKDGGE